MLSVSARTPHPPLTRSPFSYWRRQRQTIIYTNVRGHCRGGNLPPAKFVHCSREDNILPYIDREHLYKLVFVGMFYNYFVGDDAHIVPIWCARIYTGRCGHRPLQYTNFTIPINHDLREVAVGEDIILPRSFCKFSDSRGRLSLLFVGLISPTNYNLHTLI